jgi:Sec-independent protein translocase protein TatA
MGKATKEFQKARTEVEGDIRTVMSQEPAIDHQETEHQAEATHSETVSEHEKERS